MVFKLRAYLALLKSDVELSCWDNILALAGEWMLVVLFIW